MLMRWRMAISIVYGDIEIKAGTPHMTSAQRHHRALSYNPFTPLGALYKRFTSSGLSARLKTARSSISPM